MDRISIFGECQTTNKIREEDEEIMGIVFMWYDEDNVMKILIESVQM